MYGLGVALPTHINITGHANGVPLRMAQLISIGQIIDNAFHLYQKHFTNYARIGAWLFLTVPLLIAANAVFPIIDNPITAAIVIGSITFVNTVLTILVGYFVSNSYVFSTDAYEEGKKSDPEAIRGLAWSRVGHVFVQGVLLALMLFLAVCLLLPGIGLFVASSLTENPGVVLPSLGTFLLFAGGAAAVGLVAWFGVIFAFAPFTLLLERRGIIESIKRAFALVRGRWWATMVRVMIPKLTMGVIVLFLQLIVIFFFFIISSGLAPLSAAIGETAVTVVVSALQQLAVIAVAAVTTPAFVIADYYVFKNLAATRRAS